MISLLSKCQGVAPTCPARRRGQVISASLPLSSPQDGPHPHARGVETSASATYAAPWLTSLSARFTERIPKTIEKRANSETVSGASLKHKLVHMPSYQSFVSHLAAERFLLDDWLDLTSRPFVQGHIDAILANKAFGALLAADEQLRVDVEAIIMNIDTAMSKGRNLPWLVGVVAALAHYSGIYHVVEVADRGITNDTIARFESALDTHIRTASVVEIRREVHLIRQVLSPLVLDMVLRCIVSTITPERAVRLAAVVDEIMTEKDLLTSLSISSVSSMSGDSQDVVA